MQAQEQYTAKSEMIATLRYFEEKKKVEQAPKKPALHSEFLRTGRIDRNRPNWDGVQKRYLTYEEVAERAGKQLTAAGERTHERLNSFHRSIRFPKLIFHRTLKERASRLLSRHRRQDQLCGIQGREMGLLHRQFLRRHRSRASDLRKDQHARRTDVFRPRRGEDEEQQKLTINTAVRGNGLLFRTQDPKVAFKNVLMLEPSRTSCARSFARSDAVELGKPPGSRYRRA